MTMGERAKRDRKGASLRQLIHDAYDDQYAPGVVPDAAWTRNTGVRAWPGGSGFGPPLGETFNQPAQQVTVQGEAQITNDVTIHVEPSPTFWAEAVKKFSNSQMTLRDKTGTSLGGATGTTQPLPTP